MTARQYLYEVFKLKRKAENLTIEEEDLRARAEGMKAIVYDKDRVQTSAEDRMPELIAELVAVQEEMIRTVAECYREIQRREDMINALKSIRQIEVLRWRYLKDKVDPDSGRIRQYYFSEIGKKMGLRASSVRNLHDRAIKNFSRLYKMGTP